jgi:excinuclease UvrABC helicase subunit UvrB
MARKNLDLERKAEKRPVQELVREKELRMKEAAQALEFELAALLRDEIKELKRRGKR